ncbi:MAG: NAD(P)-dependent oxidoreductase [Candidatus Aenigmatarchaeota archaeon]
MKPKIALTKDLNLYNDQKKRLESLGDVVYHNELLKSPDEWLERCRGADIICSGIFGLRSDKVYELKDVFISLPFVGVEFLDKKKLNERNITISNSPGCNKEPVSEWIVAMMLIHFRRLLELTRTKNPSRDEVLKAATSLYDKKITILGAGFIGKQLGKICDSLGMKVRFFRRGDDLLESVKDADTVVNCLSVNSSTMEVLNRDFFFSLKKGAFFVSISKSQVYDIEALKEALDKEILSGAADDAASAEVGDVNEPAYKTLLEHPKILVTPHISWNTDAERRHANDIMIDNIETWIKGKPINLI